SRGKPTRRNVTQWRPRRPLWTRWLVSALVLLSCGLAQAQEFGGTWKLTARKLPNGTTLTPPAAQGSIMSQSGVWSRVVFWHTPEGNPALFLHVSTYNLAPPESTETLLSTPSVHAAGKPPAYCQTHHP